MRSRSGFGTDIRRYRAIARACLRPHRRRARTVLPVRRMARGTNGTTGPWATPRQTAFRRPGQTGSRGGFDLTGSERRKRLDSLSEGEADCLRLVGQGYSSKQIARLLPYRISIHTIDQRLRTAIRKLDAINRQEAARIYETHHDAEPYQALIYQAENLVAEDVISPTEAATKRRPIRKFIRNILAPLPMGGQENDLTSFRRTLEIIRIASLGAASLLAVVLSIAGALAAFH